MRQPKVGIVYLAYYPDKTYIDAAADSVAAQSYPKDQLLFIVSDNSQGGEAAQYIHEQIVPRSGQDLPPTLHLKHETNTGFAIGNNLGIQAAIEAGCEYVFLLNNDAYMDSGAIENIVRVAQSDERIGAVQALMMLWKKPRLVNSAGNDIHFLGFGLMRHYTKDLSELALMDGEPIGYASGAAVLYRVEALQDVGLLDDLFWMYHEDLELGWRMRLRDWHTVLASSARVYHNYEFSRSTKQMYWMERNRHITHLIHLRLKTLLLLAPAMLLMEFAVFGGSVLGGWWKEKLKSWAALWSPKLLYAVWVRRRESQRTRKIKDRYAVAMFRSQILHQEVQNPILRYLLNPFLRFYWYLIRLFV